MSLVTVSGGVLVGGASPAAAAPDRSARRIVFPVENGAVRYSDDFGDPRSGGRSHQGNDLMGTKLQKLLAAADGTISYVRLADGPSSAGNMLSIRDSAGWKYNYIHINNDSPGTDDGANPPEWRFAPGIARGTRVTAGQHIAYLGDSGNAEGTAPHLHFEIQAPDGTHINPYVSLRLAQGLPTPTRCSFGSNPAWNPDIRSAPGYWILGSDGGIFTFGTARFFGSVPGLGLGQRVTALLVAALPNATGYHVLGADGGVFSFGDARFFGSVPGLGRRDVRAVDLRMTRSGQGYWVLASSGEVFAFGDAKHAGDLVTAGVAGPGVATKRLVPHPTGNGYWLLGTDGGVFSFGDAAFKGSVPGLQLPVRVTVQAMAPSTSGDGYWVLGTDGGVFSFGDARYFGSVPGEGMCTWPQGVQLVPSPTGGGYWVHTNDGGVWSFGDAFFHGDLQTAGVRGFGSTVDMVLVQPQLAGGILRPILG